MLQAATHITLALLQDQTGTMPRQQCVTGTGCGVSRRVGGASCTYARDAPTKRWQPAGVNLSALF